MSAPVISVQNLGKRYLIRHEQRDYRRYKSLRDVMAERTRSAARRFWTFFGKSRVNSEEAQRRKVEEFWALKNLCFELQQGEVVGIVGRNGAGKSTMLKLLSRITEPTEGRVTLRGRVASLLEVGTGFHPELTGRENVFLNGAILGMRRSEIRQKFDEIVAFAEAERFLDTPVKHYSSGMHVRLAFAVAAHLEPEILIVDEVLAVGDVAFQKKCLGKMQDVSKGGRTVLFVSHNMEAMRTLCSRGIFIEGGHLKASGKIGDVIHEYLSRKAHTVGGVQFERRAGKPFQFLSLRVTDKAGQPKSGLDACKPFVIELVYEVATDVDGLEIALRIHNANMVPVTTLNSSDGLPERAPMKPAPGTYEAKITIPAHFLGPNDYFLSPVAFQFNRQVFDSREQAIQFSLLETGSRVTNGHPDLLGVVLNYFPWSNTRLSS